MELICFPSADPLRDLVLPLHLRPRRIRLLIPPDRRAVGARLRQCLADRDFDVQWAEWPAFDKCDDHAGQVMTLLSGPLEAAGEREVVLALGASAGVWELACQQVLRQLLLEGEFRVMALTRDSGYAVRLEPGPVHVERIESLLEPANYLAACNATLRRSASAEARHVEATQQRRGLTLDLARHCHALGPALGTLNYLAHQAVDDSDERLVQPRQHLPFDAARPLRRALTRLVGAGLLDFDSKRELVFKSVEACRYIAGGWLEEYAWLTAAELGAEHVHAGLELTWNAGKGPSPRNELDLFIVHRNRALTVECKTANMGEGDETAKILYKLDSIADRLSALPGNAVLLSAREVPELIIKRARAQGTEVFASDGLSGFRDWLKGWLDHGLAPPSL